MEGLIKICKFWDIPLIEDCAQAHGATIGTKKVGGFGTLGCFSFYATKNLSTGEGGAVTTTNGFKATIIRKLINHGMTDRDTHEILGYNYRMGEIPAMLGISQLEDLEENNKKRIENSQYLMRELIKEDWLVPQIPQSLLHKHVYFTCPFYVNEKKVRHATMSLVKALQVKNIEVRHRYHEPIYHQPVLKKYEHQIFGLMPNSDRISGKIIGLPNHPGLTERELDKIVRGVKDVSE